jgi:hypothetical protein
MFAPTAELPCRLKLSFSLYFDGTRNSRDEDKPVGPHSNVARLADLSISRHDNCIYRLYIQGVGTRFPEIGESEPHPDGAKEGAMGDRRIRYAMLFIANRVAGVAYDRNLVDEDPGNGYERMHEMKRSILQQYYLIDARSAFNNSCLTEKYQRTYAYSCVYAYQRTCR